MFVILLIPLGFYNDYYCPTRAVALRAGSCAELCHRSSLAVVTVSALTGVQLLGVFIFVVFFLIISRLYIIYFIYILYITIYFY